MLLDTSGCLTPLWHLPPSRLLPRCSLPLCPAVPHADDLCFHHRWCPMGLWFFYWWHPFLVLRDQPSLKRLFHLSSGAHGSFTAPVFLKETLTHSLHASSNYDICLNSLDCLKPRPLLLYPNADPSHFDLVATPTDSHTSSGSWLSFRFLPNQKISWNQLADGMADIWPWPLVPPNTLHFHLGTGSGFCEALLDPVVWPHHTFTDLGNPLLVIVCVWSLNLIFSSNVRFSKTAQGDLHVKCQELPDRPELGHVTLWELFSVFLQIGLNAYL